MGSSSEEKKVFKPSEMEKWQKKKLFGGVLAVLIIGVTFLSFTVSTLYQDKLAEDRYWNAALNQPQEELTAYEARAEGAVPVTVGTYIESVKEINLKTSSFRLVAQVWFRWNDKEMADMTDAFHVYNGYINKQEVLRDFHKDGQHYQLLRCDVTVSKEYWNVRFPLESHQLRFYIESERPLEQVVFVPDTQNSGVNGNLSVSGFGLVRHEVGVFYQEYANTHSDPELEKPFATSEIVTAMEFNRSSWGLYVKCFIALVGTTTWVMIALFLCTYHRVDPLGMVPAALFGTVTNIMVGANLLPDALQTGLLEYVNIWGIMVILGVTITIININRIRNRYEDKAFASFFGRIMFFSILVFTLTGHALMPIAAYLFS